MTGKSSSVKGNYCCRQASLHLALLSSWETCDSTSFGPIDPDGLHLVLLKARIQVSAVLRRIPILLQCILRIGVGPFNSSEDADQS